MQFGFSAVTWPNASQHHFVRHRGCHQASKGSQSDSAAYWGEMASPTNSKSAVFCTVLIYRQYRLKRKKILLINKIKEVAFATKQFNRHSNYFYMLFMFVFLTKFYIF